MGINLSRDAEMMQETNKKTKAYEQALLDWVSTHGGRLIDAH